MIPILFDGNSTSYKGNGLGRLADCVTCLVTEERNGIYECEFTYPVDGDRFSDIEEGRVILATHDEQGDTQPFIIYRRSAPINGLVTFYAHHVSYNLSSVIVAPFTASRVADAIVGLKNNALTNCPFTFWTDKTTQASFSVKVPTSARSLLGGTEGSILDVYGGGDYQWDSYHVKLYAHRGSDNGVTIRYGKNMTDLVYEKDILDLYNAVIPYWSNDDATVYGGVVYGSGGIKKTAYWTDEEDNVITDENGDPISFEYYDSAIRTMDLSSQFEEQPTVAQLETRAKTLLGNNSPWTPKVNIKVDFVSLWQTKEYAAYAPLERVRLCDTVTVYYEALGVSAKAKVIKTVWNPLIDKYVSIELGDAKTTFAETMEAATEMKLQKVPTTSEIDDAIAHATELITGGAGGHIVFRYDDDGKPTEMFVMDTDDVTTATNVLRINVNGIGFSHTGINGSYTSAWTLDGQFVADFITAGALSATRISGGTLTLGGTTGGIMSVLNSSGTEIVRADTTGITINEGSISIGNGAFTVYPTGVMSSADATINGMFRSEKDNEWMQIYESILSAGYGSTMHGLLDVSAQTGGTYDVALEALVNNLRLKAKKNVFITQDEDFHVDAQDAYIRCSGEISLQTDGNVYLNGADDYVIRGGQSYRIVDTSGADSTGRIRHIYRVTSSGTTYLGITNIAGNTLYATLTASDEKLKTNISDAEDVGLEAINKIQHKSFDFIDGGYHRNCGYIAQQIQDAIPYSTIAAPEHDEEGNKIGETLQLNDHEILVYATKAIQELSAKVDELERRLAEKEG